MATTADLDQAIKRVCPIVGVEVGRKDDRSTWAFQPTDEASAEQIAAGKKVLEAFSFEDPTEKDYGDAVQAHLDAWATAQGYDSIAAMVSYADDPNPQFAAEGRAAVDWRSAVWTHVAQRGGFHTPPPSIEEFIAGLPAPAWPG